MTAAADVAASTVAEMKVEPAATEIAHPKIEEVGVVATRGLDQVTQEIVEQIDAAIDEFERLRVAVIEMNRASRTQIEQQVAMGVATSEIVGRLRAGFARPVGGD